MSAVPAPEAICDLAIGTVSGAAGRVRHAPAGRSRWRSRTAVRTP